MTTTRTVVCVFVRVVDTVTDTVPDLPGLLDGQLQQRARARGCLGREHDYAELIGPELGQRVRAAVLPLAVGHQRGHVDRRARKLAVGCVDDRRDGRIFYLPGAVQLPVKDAATPSTN
jgi:hypothetical protein